MSFGSDHDSSSNVGDPTRVVRGFAHDLAQLRERQGGPSFARMQSAIRHISGVAGSKNTFHRMVTDPDRIYEPEFVRGFVLALGLDENEATIWEQRRVEAVRQHQLAREELARKAAGEGQPRQSDLRSLHDVHPVDRDASDRMHRIPEVAATIGDVLRRKQVFAAVGVVLVILTAAMLLLRRSNIGWPHAGDPATSARRSASLPARFVGGREAVADNADPKKTGCAADPGGIRTLDQVQINTTNENYLGDLQLRHSPSCHASWGRFEPSDRPIYLRSSGPIRVTIIAHRPATGTVGTPYTTAFDGQAAFGNILLDVNGCVEVEVHVDAPGGGGSATTNCMRE